MRLAGKKQLVILDPQYFKNVGLVVMMEGMFFFRNKGKAQEKDEGCNCDNLRFIQQLPRNEKLLRANRHSY